MSDIENYIQERSEREPDFGTLVDAEYQSLRIGQIIRKLRQEYRMSQKELAEELHTTKSAISRLENHAESIRLSTLEQVARVFDRKVRISIEP